MKNNIFGLIAFICTAIAVIALGWVGDLLAGSAVKIVLLESLWANNGVMHPVFSGLLFLIFSWLAYHFGRRFFPIRHLGSAKTPRPHKVLIAPLSVLNDADENCDQFLTGDISQDIATLASKSKNGEIKSWNGEMLLRGLQAHQGKLEAIYFIGSSNSGGSMQQKDRYNRIVSRYFPNITPQWRPCNFENISELYETIESMIEDAIRHDYTNKDIIIDCTGGQKPTSIAAALATLHHNGIEFQYVQTGAKNVLAYNMVNAPNKAHA